jgi:hypothetical protein
MFRVKTCNCSFAHLSSENPVQRGQAPIIAISIIRPVMRETRPTVPSLEDKPLAAASMQPLVGGPSEIGLLM